ncbi:PTS-dependent dihydroxyacetone kinase 2, dihydroxyacetone-binding subunit DhaK [bioreactor metagenome]|uniref:PTS-dependent dihydroxyacetone kinase 2, dihydroxyacetone-binding subunit DhaK n=1 Tax=bioreactor metagenome TaxID=1076179 RepID=A0A645D760_9ZZZZ
MAKEMAEAEDLKVDYVVVNDDVAVEDSTWTTGRRGIAGTVLVHKIAGAKAETGAELPEVKAVAEKVIKNVRSMGLALSPCIVPAAGKPNFTLGEDEMEVGMGIHGEPGVRRGKIEPADAVIDEIMDPILKDLPYEAGDEVYVLVNSLGATPVLDLHICYRRVAQILEEKGIKVHRALVGPFACSMDMAGMSVTLCKLDDELKELLDYPCDTPYFTQV